MSILSKINKSGGIYLFKNPNTLTFSIFNYFYNKFIINTDDICDELKSFHDNGYLKTNLNFKTEVENLYKNLDDQIIDKKRSSYRYKLNNKTQEIIKNEIVYSKKFQDLKKKLEKYFNLKIYLINIDITRNFPIDKNLEHKVNIYSNNYHVDYYIMNYFKIFINLHDVDETQGPMNLFSKKNSSKFIKMNNYKNRADYKFKSEPKIEEIKNIGSAGDVFICSTPQCLHRATSPQKGKMRDMLYLSFAATNEIEPNSDLFHYEKKYLKELWSNGSQLRKSLCKPNSARKLIKIFFNFYKNKINN